jgi:hypothetical protein
MYGTIYELYDDYDDLGLFWHVEIGGQNSSW